jgi:hypothetical protein
VFAQHGEPTAGFRPSIVSNVTVPLRSARLSDEDHLMVE